MKSFAGKVAVITGGGAGIGRELALRLVSMGCDVAVCDVFPENMAETKRLCLLQEQHGARVSIFVADVSIEDQVLAFAEAVTRDLETDHIDLLFNNAGIGTLGGSFVDGDRAEWDKTFDVCWYGVYYCTRAFLPLLRKADEGHIVNTSSVNGFWASNNTAYSTAKFAVKGFTEALINDLSLNAPHIKCSVVMPGRIGTDILANSILNSRNCSISNLLRLTRASGSSWCGRSIQSYRKIKHDRLYIICAPRRAGTLT